MPIQHAIYVDRSGAFLSEFTGKCIGAIPIRVFPDGTDPNVIEGALAEIRSWFATVTC